MGVVFKKNHKIHFVQKRKTMQTLVIIINALIALKIAKIAQDQIQINV